MRTTSARVVTVSLSATAVLGLAACGGGSAPSVSQATGAPSSTSTSQTPSSTSSSTTPSSSVTPSDTSTSSSSSSSSSSSDSSPQASGALPSGCASKVSPKTADLKIGQPAVFKDRNDATVCMTPTKLTVAPDAVYEGTLTKTNGTVYFLDVNYGYVGGGTKPVKASDINQLQLHPVVASGQKGKTFYGSVPGCEHKGDYNTIPAGKSQDTCIIYQVSGAKATSVLYNNYTVRYLWK